MTRVHKKVIVMRITFNGSLETRSFVNYRETPTEIIPLDANKPAIKKSYLDYLQSPKSDYAFYRYELISRDMSYADMKTRLIDWAILHEELAISSRQNALASLTKL